MRQSKSNSRSGFSHAFLRVRINQVCNGDCSMNDQLSFLNRNQSSPHDNELAETYAELYRQQQAANKRLQVLQQAQKAIDSATDLREKFTEHAILSKVSLVLYDREKQSSAMLIYWHY
jgi:hypothetical protein